MIARLRRDLHGTPMQCSLREWRQLRPMHIRATAVAAICVALCGPSASAATGEPTSAEYAIRWNARDGGPKSGDEVLLVLGGRARRTSLFDVSYYDVPSAPTAPPGFATILRRRVDGAGASDLTWKLRGDRALAAWTCPFENSLQSKVEVDVAFSGADTVTRTYSYSCASASPETAASSLAASLKACTAAVKRWEAGRLKIEEWRLPGDVLMIEVSGNGANTRVAMEHFRKRVAAPLFAAGIVPSTQSKTELGSRCQ
jgi:hypothetical protein